MKKINLLTIGLLLSSYMFGQLAVESVAVFKNGTAFIHKAGTVKTKEGLFKWDEDLPLALYGTFWFASSTGTIQSVSSTTGKVESEKEWTNFFELLKANIGKEAVVYLEDNLKFNGTISNAQGENIILKDGEELYIINGTEIVAANLERSLNSKFKSTTTKPYINIQFEEKASSQKLETMYLSKGFNWTPMYRLVLKSKTEGQLYLKASLVNDGEEFNNADMKLMVGSPNMYSTTQLSDLLSFGGGGVSYNFKSNELSFKNKSAGFYESNADRRADNSFGAGQQNSATNLEDLYFFQLKNISLGKGDRAHYPLFNTKVKVEHKYVTRLNDNNTVNNGYFREKYIGNYTGSKINHQLKVWNHSKNPFTSGTILVNKLLNGDQQALATAKLDYTAIGNCAYITLSNAPDIEIKQEEKEIERTSNSKYWNKQKYIAIKVQSTITLKSYKKEAANMEVKRLVYGKLENSDTDWESKEVINRYYLNNGNNVTWKCELKPGEEKKIVYTYTVYVRI